MFCKFCGSQIDDNSTFCAKCGNNLTSIETSAPTPTPPPVTNNAMPDVYSSNVILKQEYRTGSFNSQLVGVILFIVIFAIIMGFLLPKNSPINNLPSSKEDFIRILLSISAIGAAVCAVIASIKLMPLKKTFICVTETGVYGCAGSPLYFTSKPFTLNYGQITSVSASLNALIIGSGGESYKCIIDREDYIANIIREKIDQKTINPTSNPKHSKAVYSVKVKPTGTWTCPKCGIENDGSSNSCKMCGAIITSEALESNSANNNTWICPNCGKINQNYVGTCGCGQIKP